MDLDRIGKVLANPSLESLGAYLGFSSSPEEKAEANLRAKCLFQLAGILPEEDHQVRCEFVHPDGSTCGKIMRRHQDPKRASGCDSRFVCLGGGRRHTKLKISIHRNTIFEKKNLPYSSILQLLMCFFEDVPLLTAVQISNVEKKTAIAWYRKFRVVMHKIAWHDFEPLGGPTYVVELDESFLYKAKFNVGRQLATTRKSFWSFGGVCRVSKRMFATVVLKRDRNSLFEIMRRHIKPQTHICTDGWKAYKGCELPMPLGCAFASHNVVIHKTNFLFPPRHMPPLWKDATQWHFEARDKQHHGPYLPGHIPFRHHTQNQERRWKCLQDHTSHGGPLTLEKLEEYMGAFMYRHNILRPQKDKMHKFCTFLDDIRRLYPGAGNTGIADRELCECCAH